MRRTTSTTPGTLEYRRTYKRLAASVRAEYRVDRSIGPQGGFFTQRHGELAPTQHRAVLAVVLRSDGVR